MAKQKSSFVCRECGSIQRKWMGKCSDCGTWDSLEEQVEDKGAKTDPQRGIIEGWKPDGAVTPIDSASAIPFSQIDTSAGLHTRIPTRIAELDRVLGGGLVPGSVTLVGGSPGIGKSTLLLQAANAISTAHPKNNPQPARVLYVSSEESAAQVKLRAQRLGADQSDDLFVLSDTNLARIVEQSRKVQPDVMIIDSIQMIYKGDLDAAPGSVTQLRRCASELVYLAKLSGIAIILVGHVTKQGTIAGPKLLEHLVDAVLAFEGDRYHAHRIVRGIKNRFGTTMEIGIFEMTGGGLEQVRDGASALAIDGASNPRPGTTICPLMTGSRCILVELQALTATGFLGSAKRKASGVDGSRLAMLIAVLEQHAGLRLADRDIFTSAVGGIKVSEPASDLALMLAIAGSHYRRAVPPHTAAVGEIGLGGEIRSVAHTETRAREAHRLGIRTLILPHGSPPPPKLDGLRVQYVKTVDHAISLLDVALPEPSGQPQVTVPSS